MIFGHHHDVLGKIAASLKGSVRRRDKPLPISVRRRSTGFSMIPKIPALFLASWRWALEST